ncbi:predicted protein [Sclerotinia sclerotiorum 1980 UF-70]|uniref:Uncharacterized protein n=1 Tax=Sclerotinia sclerotiorum (strain ATCC 18683 / 1980 / Ss-1) TaxID=665079 RepID=A7F604_SCLS1|nr:predicted protein [Sclerotinia sclerotiorum 1980 UF-70]EDN98175.1 predicted protein [Sclerotinia sclerotiorum 1980 UF-70]
MIANDDIFAREHIILLKTWIKIEKCQGNPILSQHS